MNEQRQHSDSSHIPMLTGGVGKEELREFYSERFIPQMPPDTEIIPISQTIGHDQLVDEMLQVHHTVRMDWMLPGIAATGKRVEVPWSSSFASGEKSWFTSHLLGPNLCVGSAWLARVSHPPRSRN